MKKVAAKNRVMFLGTPPIVSMIAIFIFAGFFAVGLFAVPRAHAYAIGSASTGNSPAPSIGSNYNAGSSLENLISPFTGFINSLKFNSMPSIDTGGQGASAQAMNLAPTIEGGAQNVLSRWLSEFDHWFYGLTGIQLSGIVYVLLNAIAWTLGLAQQVVKWLLGLFR